MLNLCLNKQYLTPNDIEVAANYGGQDIFPVVPFLSESLYFDKLIPGLGRHNESLFTKSYFSGKKSIKQTTIQDCSFSVLPFKFSEKDERVKEICENAHFYNKQVVSFYTDDSAEMFSLPKNLFLFRTSTDRHTIQKNERVMPALHPDHFSGEFDCRNSISFCGQLTELRYYIINELYTTGLDTNFIIRQGFWAPEVESKVKARKQYYENLLSSRYALCIRGLGNFSFRFYEALCFGRIPILIDTNSILPFEHIIDWEKHIIRITEKEVSNLPKLLTNDTRCMKSNRKLWETYFSVEGYTKNFVKELEV